MKRTLNMFACLNVRGWIQQKEIEQMMEYELQMQEIRRLNEEKLEIQKERDGERTKDLMKKRKEVRLSHF